MTAVAAGSSGLAAALAGELRYSTVWEDHLLLEEGLAVDSDDELLVIASAGCNVLNLLLRAPRRIVAIDFNPAQIALVELKLAALRALDHSQFLALLGVREGEDPLALYELVRAKLSPPSRSWWDGQTPALAAGIEGAGRLERFIAGFREQHLAHIHTPERLAALFTIEPESARRRYAIEELLTPELVDAFRSYFTRESLAARGRSPEQLRYVETADIAGSLLRRLRWVCAALPTRDNFYLERFFFGAARDSDRAAPYLRRSAFARLQALAPRVELVCADLAEYLDTNRTATLTKAALSDVFEYLSDDESDALFGRLATTLPPGGRIAYWNLFVPRRRPSRLSERLRRLDELSRALTRRDRAWFYSAFHVEETCAV